MSKQTTKEELQGIDKKEASKLLECPANFLQYFAWPQTFSSSEGPFGGFERVSTFTIEAWSDGHAAVLFCKGKYLKKITSFEPMKADL